MVTFPKPPPAAVMVWSLRVTFVTGGNGFGAGGTDGLYGGVLLMAPWPGFPVFVTPFPGQLPTVGDWLVLMLPLTDVLVPPRETFPFEPTFPLAFVRLLGGLVGVASPAELKLPVCAFPAMPRAPQPVPTAN